MHSYSLLKLRCIILYVFYCHMNCQGALTEPGSGLGREFTATLAYSNTKTPENPNKVYDLNNEADVEASRDFIEQRRSLKEGIKIKNVGNDGKTYKLDQNGFIYGHYESSPAFTKVANRKAKIAKAEEEVQALVKEITNADQVILVESRVRDKIPVVKPGVPQLSDAPVLAVHSDYAPEGAASVFKEVTKQEVGDKKQVKLIHVWQPFKTVKNWPITVLDWKSVQPNKEEIHWHKQLKSLRSGPLLWAHKEHHEWRYLENQTPNDPLLILQYDSGAKEGIYPAYTAFDGQPQNREKASDDGIEVKVFAVWNKQS